MTWSDGWTRSIYVIKNVKTNRMYVGCTTKALESRIQMHFALLRRQSHNSDRMQADYNKYGVESFVWKTVRQCQDKKEASRLEAFYMNALRTHDERYGYNSQDKKGTGWKAELCKLRLSPYIYGSTRSEAELKLLVKEAGIC